LHRIAAQGLYHPSQEHDACGVGFVADIHGRGSHDIVHKGVQVLVSLEHRGACGCDPETGDGAGILIQLPDRFLRREAESLGFELPAPGGYASGLVFLSQDEREREVQAAAFERAVASEGQRFLGWREVPIDPSAIGRVARSSLPAIRQVFVAAAPELDESAFERKLYVLRRVFEREMAARPGFAYVPSLSPRTFAYTGLLMATQMERFFRDLEDPLVESALALVHSRYSTNTLGAWDLSHPFRFMAHNGEINTLRGNRNYMRRGRGRCARLASARTCASSTRSCARPRAIRRSSTTCSSSCVSPVASFPRPS
jgi:glutamate synthase domain-containing protein 1